MSEMRHQLIVNTDDVADSAAGWLALRRSGKMTVMDQTELNCWLAANPANAAAFEAAQRAWDMVELAREYPEVLALCEEAVLTRGRSSAWLRRYLPVAASIAIAFVLSGTVAVGGLSWADMRMLFGPSRQELQTSVGQTTNVTLPDGSVVTLDTDTKLRTIESRRERRVELLKGQAFFRVAKDPGRPFVVVAGDRKVTAVGTEFGVRLDKSRFQLTMVEGVVRVEAPLSSRSGAPARVQTATMAAGSQLAVVNQQWTIKSVDPLKETGWTRGLLIYEATPIEQVAEELNRYSDRKIVIEDPEAGRRLVNGTFRANDVDGAVTALESYGIVRVTSEDQNVIRLAAAKKNPERQGM